MANKLGFLAYAVESADNSRTALLRFTIAAGLAYRETLVTEGGKEGDEVKAALKTALRNRGEDRKTADRVVNKAVKTGVPLFERFNEVIDWGKSVGAVVQDIIDLLALDGVRNVAAFEMYLGLKEAPKVKDEPGAKLADILNDMADGKAGDAFSGAPSPDKPAEPEPAAMSQNETFTVASLDLTQLTMDQLTMLADAVAAEMVARQQAVALVANG